MLHGWSIGRGGIRKRMSSGPDTLGNGAYAILEIHSRHWTFKVSEKSCSKERRLILFTQPPSTRPLFPSPSTPFV